MRVSCNVLLALMLALVIAGAQATEKRAIQPEKKSQIKPKETKETKESKTAMVKLETTLGDIVLALDIEKAPITVKNFIDYVNRGHYNGTIFHRVIPGFMVQGGGMKSDMSNVPTQAPIKNEAANGLKNMRGSIAMARTNAPDSATAQFFINEADNDFLNYSPGNPGYAVFGRVAEGMSVVDVISKVKTGQNKGHNDVPITAIFIKRATVLAEVDASKDKEVEASKKLREAKALQETKETIKAKKAKKAKKASEE